MALSATSCRTRRVEFLLASLTNTFGVRMKSLGCRPLVPRIANDSQNFQRARRVSTGEKMDPFEKAGKGLVPINATPNPGMNSLQSMYDPITCSNTSMRKVFGAESEIDGLLANAGYTVKASDLAHVAQRLEQLESVMGAVQDPGISHLASEAVHYNPSDLAGWIESMLGELNPGLAEHAATAVYREGVAGTPFSEAHERSLSSASHKDGQFRPSPTLSDIALMEDYGLQFNGTEVEEVSHVFAAESSSSVMGAATAQDVFLQESTNGPVGAPRNRQDSNEGHVLHGLPLRAADSDPVRDEIPRLNKHSGFPQNLGRCSDEGSSLPQWETAPQLPARLSPVGYGQQATTIVNGDDGAQESGIRLVHLLMGCAEAIQRNELKAASEIVREIGIMVRTQSGAMGKVASHFVEALARRIYGLNSPDSMLNQADAQSEILYHHFYEACPYLKFAHFTANQAILEAFEGHERVHVIDFNLMHGLQWPALIQALALRPGGPPSLRLTGIGPRQPDGRDVLQEIGMKLAQLADSVNVEFDFRGVMADKLDDVKPWMLQVRPGEIIAVNSILQLHRLLYCDASGSYPIDVVLKSVRSLRPKIITIVEHEANHSAPVFLDRFMEALHYYSTMFDSLEACNLPPQSTEKLLAEMYIQKEICNIVACEGPYRVERHEPLSQWRIRLASAGFKPLHLGSNAFKQASMLLTLFSGEGYTVEENNGSLTLGWHSRPLIAASAWQGF
eukprot:Gb_34637 [translate_table: standard]